MIHTDDLGGAVLASLHAPSGVYNVGAEPVRRLELVQGYADAVGAASAALHRLPRPAGSSARASSRWPGRCGSAADHFAAQTGWRAVRPKFDAELARRRPPGRVSPAGR